MSARCSPGDGLPDHQGHVGHVGLRIGADTQRSKDETMRLGCRAGARNAMMHWPGAAHRDPRQLFCNQGVSRHRADIVRPALLTLCRHPQPQRPYEILMMWIKVPHRKLM
jgi:hypothetical protein